MRKLPIIGLMVVTLMALTISSAFAAQGTITEVNPSGIGVASIASEGKVDKALMKAGVGTTTSKDSGIPNP